MKLTTLIKWSLITLVFVSISAVAQAAPLTAGVYLEDFEEGFPLGSIPTDWSRAGTSNQFGIIAGGSGNKSGAISATSSFASDDIWVATPQIILSGHGGSITPHLFFDHKYDLEQMFDGGKVEISINSAPFVDVIDAGGTFEKNGYNTLISNGLFKNQMAWSGTSSANFKTVQIKLPQISENTPFQIRWRIGNDASVGGGFWTIDSIRILPELDLVTSIFSASREVVEGQDVLFNVVVTNNSFADGSIATDPQRNFLSLNIPSFNQPGPLNISEGSIFPQGNNNFLLQFKLPKAGESASFGLTLKAQKPRLASSMIFLDSPSLDLSTPGPDNFPARPADGAPTTGKDGVAGQIIYLADGAGTYDDDLCEALPTPALASGRIAFMRDKKSCPARDAVLRLQDAGAIGVIIYDESISDLPTNAQIGSGSTPITIPVAISGTAQMIRLLSHLASAPLGSVTGRLVSSREVLSLQATLSKDIFPGSSFTNNFAQLSIPLLADADGDGTPDVRDLCPNDAAKVSPGVCGCDVKELDLNSNSVPDCAQNADLKAQLTKAKQLIKKLAQNTKARKSQKQLRSDISALVADIKSKASLPGVTTKKQGVNISKLADAVSKGTSKVLKLRATFRADKSVALQAIGKMLSSLGA